MYSVMLVDDESLILNGLVKLIGWEGLGLTIRHTASDGEEALTLFHENPVDIVITDITMHRMNGLELIKRIKKCTENPRFIILSGYDDFSYAKQAIALGIENYILKPVNEEELEATLSNVVEKLRISENQPLLEGKRLEMIKENILCRWMQNTISHFELQERTAVLGIDIAKNYYCAAMIKLDLEISEAEHALHIYSEVKNYLKQHTASTEIFNDLDSNIVCLFSKDASGDIKKEIRTLFQDVIDKVRERDQINLFITIGSIEEGYKNACKSYDHAKILLDHSLVVGYNKIVDYSGSGKKNMGALLEKIINEEKLSKLIISQDILAANQYIDGIFDEIFMLEDINPEDIQNAALKMLLVFSDISNKLCLPLGEQDGTMKKLILGIFKIGKAEELKIIIKNKCQYLIDCMKSNTEVRSPVVQRILLYINENYFEDLSLKVLGVKYNINPSYLGQIFYKEVGEQFSDYINRIKNENAKKMLLNTNLKINEIAQKVGYTDNSYFYKKFKEFYGVSPKVLRNTKGYQ